MDRRGNGVSHIEFEDSGFHTPHESNSDFVSKATAYESASNSVSEAKYSLEDKTDGKRDSVSSPDDKRPIHKREELRSTDYRRQRKSSSTPSSGGTSSALKYAGQVSVCLVHREDGQREEHSQLL